MTIIIQLIIRQWDKGQRTPEEVAEREALPIAYPISIPPAQRIEDHDCIIDFHGDDRIGDRHKWRVTKDNILEIDEFAIDLTDKTLRYLSKSHTLQDNLVCIRYTWRYGVTHNGKHYWLYENITLNAISVDETKAWSNLFLRVGNGSDGDHYTLI